jgi:hypothetical protein
LLQPKQHMAAFIVRYSSNTNRVNKGAAAAVPAAVSVSFCFGFHVVSHTVSSLYVMLSNHTAAVTGTQSVAALW